MRISLQVGLSFVIVAEVLVGVSGALAGAPKIVDLLADQGPQMWRLAPQWRWDQSISATTGRTNRALYAANAVFTDSFASVGVGSLTNDWRISARIELLRGLKEGGEAYSRLSLWGGEELLVLADITPWFRGSNRLRFWIGYWTGSTWVPVLEDPMGAWTELGGTAKAWKDLGFSRSTRRLSFSFAPEGGASAMRISDPLPPEIAARIDGVGLSCVSAEYLVHDFLLTTDPVAKPPTPPILYQRRLASGIDLLFWRVESGFRYQLDGSRDLQKWSEDDYFLGGRAGEVVEIELPAGGGGQRFFRLLVR